MSKKTIALLFGGQSSEHEISCLSAANIAEQIDRSRYELLLLGITKKGHWVLVKDIDDLKTNTWMESRTGAVLSPDATDKCVMIHERTGITKVKIDLVFPVLHGLYGEDGTVQGLCELAMLPYVGCGVAASAAGMDKSFTKRIVQTIGVDQADYELVLREDLSDFEAVAKRVESHLPYPVFVKPCNAGSSCGVTKARNKEELKAALLEAVRFDRRILVEETIVGREIECAVRGGGEEGLKVNGVGEILAAAEFYDYEAKYFNPDSKTVVNPDLPAEAVEGVRDAAGRIFRALDGFGLSRVDFFVTADNRVIFNEINTMPGFTAISMYPMLFEACGIGKKELVQRLIDLAFKRRRT